MTDTDDLVARLRRPVFGGTYGSGLAPDPLHTEAADTIEELERMHRDATADCIRFNDEADKLARYVIKPSNYTQEAEVLAIAQRRVNGETND